MATTQIKSHVTAVQSATDLIELRDALNELRDLDIDDGIVADDQIDTADLQSFGGDPPRDTTGVGANSLQGALGWWFTECPPFFGKDNAMGTDIINELIWAGDTEALDEIAPCRCCCAEHTFASCPARAWHGCRGSGTEISDDEWCAFYMKTRGMTKNQFYSVDENRDKGNPQ